MIKKEIVYFGQKVLVVCDGKCHKAWGINSRPREQLCEIDLDDYAFLSDNELGEAPLDSGIYEGGEAKPMPGGNKINKWCVRECERSSIYDGRSELKLKNFEERVHNK